MAASPRGYLITGGGRGIGRAIVERLLVEGGTVAVVERDPAALGWVAGHPAAGRLLPVVADASDPGQLTAAVDELSTRAPLAGLVNNAAVFRDADLHTAEPDRILELIELNLAPAVVGSAAAVKRFLAAGTAGSIVNISSHQAQRAVRGALPYATAKAAIEGLTRALAVDYGPFGIRANAVALGSIRTERYDAHLDTLSPDAATDFSRQIAALHPLGRVGTAGEVADAVAFLLSDASAFINGAVVPVDGGRAAQGQDPEAR